MGVIMTNENVIENKEDLTFVASEEELLKVLNYIKKYKLTLKN